MSQRKKVALSVPKDIEPIRLDIWLAAQSELALSRTKIQRLIDEGEVTVDGETVPSRYQLKGGEQVELIIPEPIKTDIEPEEIALEIVYEDDHLAVINKPVGMVTHPAAGVYSGTLVNALVHHFRTLPTGRGVDRPGIVHRLDKNTSGLLLVAKSEDTLLALQRMLEQRLIKRTYLAIICGHMPKEKGKIDLPIGRSSTDRTKMAVVDSGRAAVTEYHLLERFRSVELHEVNLQTGRTHQIRVHFAKLGHPVLGDPEYGGREKWLRGIFAPERPLARRLLDILSHQALHAHQLSLVHPVTGQSLLLKADPPSDLLAALTLLRDQPA